MVLSVVDQWEVNREKYHMQSELAVQPLSLRKIWGLQKHAAKPMEFGKTLPPFSSLGHCLCFRYCRELWPV